MTSVIGIFLVSLAVSLLLTPQVGKLATKYGVVDRPSERKVHTGTIPRSGGAAIFLAFFLPFCLIFLFPTNVLNLVKPDQQVITLIGGATLVFLLGLWDDVRRLPALIKLGVQILAALIAYWGGLRIHGIALFQNDVYYLEWLTLPITVFWFLLIINAINLIDGLDGLAAGVSLFVSLVLLVICVTTGRFLVALGFAALGGAIAGFLRYNFNPASIFMGDSGSYFLGFMLAGLSVMGSIKSPATVAILIPIIALGLPIIDVIFSPIRRFILGQGLFSPDKNHLHHRLLKLGFTHRNAVLVLYGISVLTGILAIVAVHARDDGIALILFILAGSIIVGFRKLGYIHYFAPSKVYEWLKDLTDEAGISQERRNFFNLQLEIYQSRDMKSLWENVSHALDCMGFDMAEMHLERTTLWSNIRHAMQRLGFNVNELCPEQVFPAKAEHGPEQMVWKRNGFALDRDTCRECLLKMELPLLSARGQNFGFIWLVKDLRREGISQSTLRRVEHLRRTVLGSLEVLIQAEDG